MNSINSSPLDEIDPESNYFDEVFTSESYLNNSKYFSLNEFKNYLQSDANYFNFLNYNIRSFTRNSDEFLCSFESNNLPDFLVLTETWANNIVVPVLQGYEGHHTFREHGRSGGISIFSKTNYTSIKVQELSYANVSIEVCTIELNLNNQTWYLIGLYRPHSDCIDNFSDELHQILTNPIIRNKPCFIMGDFNINLMNNDTETLTFINNLNAKHFINTITKPTRISDSHNPSILDHIWLNKPTSYASGIILTDTTDHYPTFFRLPKLDTNSNSDKIKISFRPINDASCQESFQRMLADFDWESIKSNSSNNYLNKFLKTLNEIFCQCFPEKTKFVTSKAFTNPWITPKLRKLIKIKSEFFKLYKMNIISKETNNSFKNKVKSIIDRTKVKYYKNLFLSNKNNIRKTWQIIKDILGQNNKTKSNFKIISDNIEYVNNIELAELFNDYFSKIATTLDHNLPHTNTDPLKYVENNCLSSIFLTPTTADECANLITRLKLTKTDKDSLPVKLMKDNKLTIASVLSDIINLSFKSGIFPDALKCGIIPPIFKAGNPTNKENYRPITILLVISKIFERSIYNRFIKFIADFSLISPQQYGFQKGFSTETALIALTEKMYDVINTKQIAINICIDYRKAFDTVNHSILLKNTLQIRISRAGLGSHETVSTISYSKSQNC